MCEDAVEDERPGCGGEDVVRYEVQLDGRPGAETSFWKEGIRFRVWVFKLGFVIYSVPFLCFLSEKIGRSSRPVVGKA
jgi:hypothetical protein